MSLGEVLEIQINHDKSMMIRSVALTCLNATAHAPAATAQKSATSRVISHLLPHAA